MNRQSLAPKRNRNTENAKKRQQAQKQERILTAVLKWAAALSSVCLVGGIFIAAFPDAAGQAVLGIRQGISQIQEQWNSEELTSRALHSLRSAYVLAAGPETQPDAAEPKSQSEPAKDTDTLDVGLEKGELSDLDAPAEESASSVYEALLGTSLGSLIYYHQGDLRWGDYLYGGQDPMRTYGCGPTVAAMLVSSFSPQNVSITPPEMADWAFQHGYYAPQSGSYRSLIPGALTAFGLNVTSVKDRTPAHAAELLKNGHVLVALMGRGVLTQSGHFIIISQLLEDGSVSIADPNSLDNCRKSWDLELLMGELKKVSDSGAPLWAVSR